MSRDGGRAPRWHRLHERFLRIRCAEVCVSYSALCTWTGFNSIRFDVDVLRRETTVKPMNGSSIPKFCPNAPPTPSLPQPTTGPPAVAGQQCAFSGATSHTDSRPPLPLRARGSRVRPSGGRPSRRWPAQRPSVPCRGVPAAPTYRSRPVTADELPSCCHRGS